MMVFRDDSGFDQKADCAYRTDSAVWGRGRGCCVSTISTKKRQALFRTRAYADDTLRFTNPKTRSFSRWEEFTGRKFGLLALSGRDRSWS